MVTEVLICSCASTSSATSSGPRTLIINDREISATETDNGFTSWYCTDWYDDFRTKVLVEVGYFDLYGSRFGFVLYDGGYVGELALFSRDGLDYRWQWDDYSIIVTNEGTARYYNFRGAEEGESRKPSAVYKAYKR